MKKIFAVLALMAFVSGTAFAGFGVNEDSTYEGEAGQINASTDLDVSVTSGIATISLESALNPTSVTATGDVLFQSTLIAGGRFGASSSLLSSETAINPSTIPYSLLIKSIGNNPTAEASTLPNGTSGQIFAIQIIGRGEAGSWVLSRTKGSGWDTITFDAEGENATLLYDATLGWIILSTNATIAAPHK